MGLIKYFKLDISEEKKKYPIYLTKYEAGYLINQLKKYLPKENNLNKLFINKLEKIIDKKYK